jgi:hypothetical protein
MPTNNLQYTLSLKDLFSKKMSGAIASTGKLDSKMSGLNSKMKGIGTTIAAAFSVGAVVSFGKAVLDSLVNYEYFSASLRTLMHQDVSAAKALEGQLVSLAKNTPFSLVEIQDATKQLLAYGFAGGEVVGNIKMLGDVASGLKIPFHDIAYLYGTLKTQGRAFAKDIYQFTGRGIPIVKELAKQFGVADSQVMGLVSDGKVGFPQIEKAFQSMTKEGGMFFNMMDTQTKTVGGQLSALGDNYEQLKVNIGKSQTGIIASTTTMLNTLTGAFSSFFAQANQMEENFTRFGAQQLGYFEKQYMILKSMITGSYKNGLDGDILTYDKTLQSVLANSQESVSNAKNNIVQLFRQIAEEAGKFKSGEISQKEYNRRKASLAGTIEQVKGVISLAGKKGEVSPLEAATGGTGMDALATKTPTTTQGAGTEISGNKPSNMYINITKLVETLNVNTTNLKESASKIREEVSKALLETVNDVNILAK